MCHYLLQQRQRLLFSVRVVVVLVVAVELFVSASNNYYNSSHGCCSCVAATPTGTAESVVGSRVVNNNNNIDYKNSVFGVRRKEQRVDHPTKESIVSSLILSYRGGGGGTSSPLSSRRSTNRNSINNYDQYNTFDSAETSEQNEETEDFFVDDNINSLESRLTSPIEPSILLHRNDQSQMNNQRNSMDHHHYYHRERWTLRPTTTSNLRSLLSLSSSSSVLEPGLIGRRRRIDDDTTHNNHHYSGTTTSNNMPATKTGTTIVGVRGHNCVVLAADARATSGRIVADKSCTKLHCISSSPPCVVAGAGTSADIHHVLRQCQYTFQLESLQYSTILNTGTNSNRDAAAATMTAVSVYTICKWLQSYLYQQNGNGSASCEAHLIVGGMEWLPPYDDSESATNSREDNMRPHPVLRTIHPHGSMDVVDYTALGSGSLAAMSVLQAAHNNHKRRRRRDQQQQQNPANRDGSTEDEDTTASFLSSSSSTVLWTQEEAIALAVQAVQAGLDNDMGSGSYIDICIINATMSRRHNDYNNNNNNNNDSDSIDADAFKGGVYYIQRYIPLEQLLPIQQHDNNTTLVSSTNRTNNNHSHSASAHTSTIRDTAVPSDGESQRRSRGSISSSGGGVNGFGNAPYIITTSTRSMGWRRQGSGEQQLLRDPDDDRRLDSNDDDDTIARNVEKNEQYAQLVRHTPMLKSCWDDLLGDESKDG